jgi:hypothetical protein
MELACKMHKDLIEGDLFDYYGSVYRITELLGDKHPEVGNLVLDLRYGTINEVVWVGPNADGRSVVLDRDKRLKLLNMTPRKNANVELVVEEL